MKRSLRLRSWHDSLKQKPFKKRKFNGTRLKSKRTHGGQPDVGPLDVEEGGPGDVGDRRPNLLPGVDDVDSKGVDGVAADVVAVDPRDQDLALVVVDEQSPDHSSVSVGSVLHDLWP